MATQSNDYDNFIRMLKKANVPFSTGKWQGIKKNDWGYCIDPESKSYQGVSISFAKNKKLKEFCGYE